MKKTLFTLLSLACAIALLFCFASCGIDFVDVLTVRGVYEDETGKTYDFRSSGHVLVMEAGDEYAEKYSFGFQNEGETEYLLIVLKGYEYEGDDEQIKAKVKELNDARKGHEQELAVFLRLPFEKHDGYIMIDGVRYDKK